MNIKTLFLVLLLFLSLDSIAENEKNKKKDIKNLAEQVVDENSETYSLLKNQGVTFFQSFHENPEATWNVLVTTIASESRLSVYSGENQKLLMQDLPESQGLNQLQVFSLKKNSKPFLLVVWNMGVHAYRLRIYDPTNAKKPMLFEQISNLMIDWKIEGGNLLLKVNSDEDSKAGPKEKTITWSGPSAN